MRTEPADKKPYRVLRCTSCGRITDGSGCWNHQIADAPDDRRVRFEETLCPGCIRKIFPRIEPR